MDIGSIFNTSFPLANKQWDVEICYNISHFELHGRQLENPWSCRQSLFQQNLAHGVSTWIIIQPPAHWTAGLDDLRAGETQHPLALHLRVISSAIANNTEYLEYLSSELTALVCICLNMP